MFALSKDQLTGCGRTVIYLAEDGWVQHPPDRKQIYLKLQTWIPESSNNPKVFQVRYIVFQAAHPVLDFLNEASTAKIYLCRIPGGGEILAFLEYRYRPCYNCSKCSFSSHTHWLLLSVLIRTQPIQKALWNPPEWKQHFSKSLMIQNDQIPAAHGIQLFLLSRDRDPSCRNESCQQALLQQNQECLSKTAPSGWDIAETPAASSQQSKSLPTD